jgi:hypothetical protein
MADRLQIEPIFAKDQRALMYRSRPDGQDTPLRGRRRARAERRVQSAAR